MLLQSYTFEQGPPVPRGRRKDEEVGAFIRRLQIAELRKGAKNIFADVPLSYDHMAETRRRIAAYLRVPQRIAPGAVIGKYMAAIQHKHRGNDVLIQAIFERAQVRDA